ncbi:hypothetical protein Godav_029990 [Gossypium davidsonii]|uniref:DUF4283 domain-containing protein n=1 Tax=Gossypium davidsonii TaxID=34287 RepID=A0A7J8TDM4_GOSDV|nr:hypothetical protein [Gossypium davidsonii]
MTTTMVDDDGGVSSNEDRTTEKVKFKRMDVYTISGVVNDSSCDLEFLDGDIIKSTVNGLPTISFLRENPKTFGARYGNHVGGEIPWTPEFNPLQPFPRSVMVWIRLPGLSGFFYKRKILEEIGGLIRKVAKLDFQTDRGSRGKLSRMVVFIDLEKPLVTKILVDGLDMYKKPARPLVPNKFMAKLEGKLESKLDQIGIIWGRVKIWALILIGDKESEFAAAEVQISGVIFQKGGFLKKKVGAGVSRGSNVVESVGPSIEKSKILHGVSGEDKF